MKMTIKKVLLTAWALTIALALLTTLEHAGAELRSYHQGAAYDNPALDQVAAGYRFAQLGY